MLVTLLLHTGSIRVDSRCLQLALMFTCSSAPRYIQSLVEAARYRRTLGRKRVWCGKNGSLEHDPRMWDTSLAFVRTVIRADNYRYANLSKYEQKDRCGESCKVDAQYKEMKFALAPHT